MIEEEDERTLDIAHGEDVTAGQATAEFERAAAIGALWIVILVLVVVVSLVALPTGSDGYALGDVLFEVASAQGNVGLSAGITGPDMPTNVKLTFVGSMWIGRLENHPHPGDRKGARPGVRLKMDVESLSIVGRAYQFGVNPLTTTLVLFGLLVIAFIAIAGRTPVTIGIGLGYVLSLPGSIVYLWITGYETDDTEEQRTGDDE